MLKRKFTLIVFSVCFGFAWLGRAGNPERIDHVTFLPRHSNPDDSGLYNAFIDPANGYAYFLGNYLTKVDITMDPPRPVGAALNTGSSSYVAIDSLALPPLRFGLAPPCVRDGSFARPSSYNPPPCCVVIGHSHSSNSKGLYSSGHRHKPGPKEPAQDLIQAIIEFKGRNPHLGCPKIAQQLAKSFGNELDKDVVRRVLATHYRSEGQDDGPSSLALLGHTKDPLWSVDLVRAEPLLLKSHCLPR